jgi:hypothetical protein
VSLFAAYATTAAAHRIEMMAREGNLDEYPQAWAELQQHSDELLESLRHSKRI